LKETNVKTKKQQQRFMKAQWKC